MQDGPAKGVFLQTAMRVRVGWGQVSERRWPYNAKIWPPTLPSCYQKLDFIAGFNRSRGYFSIRTISDAKIALCRQHLFQITVPITSAWTNPKDGAIPSTLSLRPSSITGIHAILICGYDDSKQRFKFQNSWGSNWGDNGHGYLPYSYVRLFAFEAWAEELGDDKFVAAPPGTFLTHSFHSQSPLGNDVVRIVAIDSSARKVGWALCTIRDHFFDVEDIFVKPGYGSRHVIEIARAVIYEKESLGLPLRVWISHCDFVQHSYNHVVIKNAALGFGLSIKPSPQRWAAWVAI